ncbi:MAG: TPM domain-containing protein [Burkholderiales bacterium]|nr:TPM domain-containing protein [Burkholderiales bacterium]
MTIALQRCLLVTCWFACLLCVPAAASDVPFLTGRVVDNAELLPAAARERLTAQLRTHEQATGNQIAVLTVPTIGGGSIEDYALRVFESWKLGQKGRDNGVLVVVAPQDRKMRIEVGSGLEGTLTDVAASRIIRNAMTPRFAAGEFERGIADGVTAIVGLLEGDAAAVPEASPASQQAQKESGLFEDGPDLPLAERILFGAFIFGIIGLFTFIGIVTPGAGWFLYVFLIPFWAMFPIVVVGVQGALTLLVVYLVGFPLAKLLVSRSSWYEKAGAELRSKGSTTVGGFTIGGGSGGSSSWSSGGGGFSGGGGRSGGGGSSGSW